MDIGNLLYRGVMGSDYVNEREKKLREDELRKKLQDIISQLGLYEGGNASTGQFAKKPISPIYIKNPLETDPAQAIGYRSPQDITGLQFQQDVGRFKATQGEYSAGQGMTKQKFTLMPREERASFIKNRLANFPGASGAMKELRPQFITPSGQPMEFTRGESGKYREMPPQAITDAEGNIIGYRPKGASFQPKRTTETQSKQFEENIKTKFSQGENLTPEEIDYYNKFMLRIGQEMKPPKKDKFGYTVGQTYKGYKYIGNNQWQK